MYNVTFNGSDIVKNSPLGIIQKDGTSFSEGLKVTGAKFSSAFETYSMPYGITSEIRNHYNEATLSLEDSEGRKMDIVLWAFDDGVAFRYDYTAEI